jgi:SAM-dependent methyltransferase
VDFIRASAEGFKLENQDFGYCLGVLHHTPDPQIGLNNAVKALKPGGQFLLYLYYALETRPWWFRLVWKTSDLPRKMISRSPFALRRALTFPIAAFVYWPLARLGRSGWPLWDIYHDKSFYTMRTDALDRFGTRIEHRFTRDQIRSMMEGAGLTQIRFSDERPYWVAHGIKA